MLAVAEHFFGIRGLLPAYNEFLPTVHGFDEFFGYLYHLDAYEFWRFVFVQQQVAKLAMTAIEYPPMQKGASFNLEAVKAKIEEAMKAHAGQ